MASRSVQISVEVGLLDRIDADEETRRDGRSAVIRRALEVYLRRKREAAVDARLEAGYGAHPDAVDEALISGQAWPSAVP